MPAATAAPARRVSLGKAADVAPTSLTRAIQEQANGALNRFYASRGFRPLWVSSGEIGEQGDALIAYLASADSDGLNPSSYDVERLRELIASARNGGPDEIARAELALSSAFARYVRDQRRFKDVSVTYADPRLKPRKLKAEGVLRTAAFPKSFAGYIADMGWMSPQYVRIRNLMARALKDGLSKDVLARLRLNLDRARLLPAPWVHHVVVDASSGRLWYYEAGKQVGAMRVVVGAKETQTPMLVGTLQWAILNPYWNVPDYLARNKIAPKVLAGRSLASMRMEALSDWTASAHKLDASAVDWAAVASGSQEVRLRELPGAGNSMGRVKFLFPNDEGIYLHDTPEKALLQKSDRHLSNGCIRLENAAELGRWLLQRPVRAISKEPEQAVPLPVQVPVYLTYLTATATDAGVAFREDVYGRDQ
ncbi:L,D-transpeptidase family protein [Sphingobium sp. SCG-1]|uniref:L,D-transpeptidase family protein n=1 Tax=Sphingobium sp. SCG-1 TaxID=2072936 RepID=UPI001CB8FC97|nr:L,D-transpeptidase family protein [Sphingobium sp. SCG-1]